MQLLAVIATVMALQIGYLLGLAIRLKVTPERPRVIEGTSVGVFGLIDDAKLAEALRDRARCPLTERFGVNRANGWAPKSTRLRNHMRGPKGGAQRLRNIPKSIMKVD
jgi:hypothetical protein